MCDCSEKINKNNKFLSNELKKAICLIKSYIYTLKIYEKLIKTNVSELEIPPFLLILVKNMLPHKTYCDDETDCDCIYDDENMYTIYKIKHCDDESSDKSDDCCIQKTCFSKYAVYCDPFWMKIEKLSRKDIIPYVNNDNNEDFIRSIQLLMAKYEGFVNYFEKIIKLLDCSNNYYQQ